MDVAVSRTPQINESLNILNDRIQYIAEKVSLLEERLAPVLAPAPNDLAKLQTSPEVVKCKLSTEIDIFAARVNGIASQLNQILNKLEL